MLRTPQNNKEEGARAKKLVTCGTRSPPPPGRRPYCVLLRVAGHGTESLSSSCMPFWLGDSTIGLGALRSANIRCCSFLKLAVCIHGSDAISSARQTPWPFSRK